MTPNQKLKASLQAIAENSKKIKLANWLKTQPGSTRRGFRRGKFQLPSYVIG